jgi:hypothetical protein
MSVIAIVLIVLAALGLLFFLGGLVVARRRRHAPEFERHLMDADRALEAARAADRGWDRSLLEAAARAAVAEQRPDFQPEDLHLVLVEDRPGVEEDRAQMVAMRGRDSVTVSLVRDEQGWSADRVE